ncbi:MAG: sulfurtransferase TusA family protein [Candidatus Dormibacteria bacterium]
MAHRYIVVDVMDAPSRTVDARGLRCPLPLVRARDAMDEVPPGGILEVLATDPGAAHDLRAWARRRGYNFTDVSGAESLRYLVRRPH